MIFDVIERSHVFFFLKWRRINFKKNRTIRRQINFRENRTKECSVKVFIRTRHVASNVHICMKKKMNY